MEDLIYKKACTILTKKTVDDLLLELIEEKLKDLSDREKKNILFIPSITHFHDWIINQPVYFYKNNYGKVCYMQEPVRNATLEEFISPVRIRDLVFIRAAIVLFYQLYYFKVVPLHVLAEYTGKEDHATIINLRNVLYDQIYLDLKVNIPKQRWLSLLEYAKINDLFPKHQSSYLNKQSKDDKQN